MTLVPPALLLPKPPRHEKLPLQQIDLVRSQTLKEKFKSSAVLRTACTLRSLYHEAALQVKSVENLPS